MLRSIFRRAAGPAAFALVSLAAVGCAGSKPVTFGDYATIQPKFEVPDKQPRPIQRVDVTLGSGAYTTLVYVVPGRGALVVYPDSTSNNFVQSGTHSLAVNFPKIPNADSAWAAQRAEARRRQAQGGNPDTSRTRPLPDLSPGTSRFGFLLLFTSPSPITYADLKKRVEGITIPIDDEPALNTVVKLVRSALPEGAAWAAFAKDIDLQG